jgi:hypothetical protein
MGIEGIKETEDLIEKWFEHKREQESETDCKYNKVFKNKAVSDLELRINKVERESTYQVPTTKSQLCNSEVLQKTDLSEVMQQISNINNEEPDTATQNVDQFRKLSHLVQNQISLNGTRQAMGVCSIADGNGRVREINGKTLETTGEEKVNISEVQATEDQKDTTEGPASLEEATAADTKTSSTEKVEIGLREREDWIFWKVRPPPKRKRQRRQQES